MVHLQVTAMPWLSFFWFVGHIFRCIISKLNSAVVVENISFYTLYIYVEPSYLLQVRAFYIDSNGLFTSVMTRGGNPVSLNNNIGLRTVFEGQLFYIGCVATLISNGKVSTSVEWIGFYIGYQSIDVEWIGMGRFLHWLSVNRCRIGRVLHRLSSNRCSMRRFSTSFISEPM